MYDHPVTTGETETSTEPYSRGEAAAWDDYYSAPRKAKSVLFCRRLALALELIDVHLCPSVGPVADLGCGAGQLVVELVKRGFTVTAVDHSEEMLRLAKRKVSNHQDAASAASFIVADLNEYRFSPMQFGAVCGSGASSFCDDVPSSIARICSSVRPGGTFLLSMPNVLSPFTWPETCARRLLQLRRSGTRPIPHNVLSLGQVKSVMQANGLIPVAVRFTFPATFLGNRCFPRVSAASHGASTVIPTRAVPGEHLDCPVSKRRKLKCTLSAWSWR